MIKIWLKIEAGSVLWPIDNKRKVVLRSDSATNRGIGFSILQYDDNGMERYITHYSKALTEAQKQYSPIELEAYTIILALDKFYKYFIGKKFRIETDAKSLLNIFKQIATEKVIKWIWRWSTSSCNSNFMSYISEEQMDRIDKQNESNQNQTKKLTI